MKQSKVIVITGSIATGKSAVTDIITKSGYEVIDADKIGHEILNFSEIVEKIRISFGDEFIENNKVNRKKLSEYVFKNQSKFEVLNEIMHSAIFTEINRRIEISNGEIVFVDIPLYFEIEDKLSAYGFKANEVWLVYVNKDVQVKRLMDRDKISKEKAEEKISSQINIDSKREEADIILDNSKDLKSLEFQIFDLLKRK